MPILFKNKSYEPHYFTKEADFEAIVEKLADSIFGTAAIYIPKKKRLKGSKIITVPDGYLIDMTNVAVPELFIIENEIVSHHPYEHIGIQLLKFATSFKQGQFELRHYLMSEINKNREAFKRLQEACKKAKSRNIDSYLDTAVYGEFKAIVLIDEAKTELHDVIETFNANVSVLEIKTFKSPLGEEIYLYDTLYDEDEEIATTKITSPSKLNDARVKRRERRALCDTIVVPAREDGFKGVFLGENCWYAVRISAAMKDRIKYIAAYQVAPISAITHWAEIDSIVPYKNTGKYKIKFKTKAKKVKQLKLKNILKKPQGPVYIKSTDMQKAKHFDDLVKY